MNKDVLNAKKNAVSEIEEQIKNAKTVVVVSYQGLTVAEMQELRKKLAEKNASLVIYKNTLAERAFKNQGFEIDEELCSGPNALIFSKEVSDGANEARKFARLHEHLVVKGGYVEGKLVDKKKMVEVAKLPSKEALLSMFCMVLNEPMAGLARAINLVAEKGNAPAAA